MSITFGDASPLDGDAVAEATRQGWEPAIRRPVEKGNVSLVDNFMHERRRDRFWCR